MTISKELSHSGKYVLAQLPEKSSTNYFFIHPSKK